MEVRVLDGPLGIESLVVVSVFRVKTGSEIVLKDKKYSKKGVTYPKVEVHVVFLEVVVEE